MLHLLPLLALSGSKGPVATPTDFESLCEYLFVHLADEEDDALLAAVDNLGSWVDETTLEEDGYAIGALAEDTVDAIGDRDHQGQGGLGGALVAASPYPPEELARPLVVEDQTEVFPGMFESFERDWEGDADCFAEGECLRIDGTQVVRAEMQLGVKVTTDNGIQFRWVETDDGPALLQRSWMREPAEVSVDWFSVADQYTLSATFARGGDVWRMQAAWLVAELFGSPVPEDMAINAAITGFKDKDELLYAWVEAH